MATYVRRKCRCCGEMIEEWPAIPDRPRCDDCRRSCYRPTSTVLGKPMPCQRTTASP